MAGHALLVLFFSSLLFGPNPLVLAHSRSRGFDDRSSPLRRRKVDISSYHLPLTGSYVDASQTANHPHSRLARRATYIDTATEFLRLTVPNATFRLLDDHYVGANGVGHAYFRQTVNGLDLDNGAFNVNVSHLSPPGFLAPSPLRLMHSCIG